MAIDVKNAVELKGGLDGLKLILGAAIIVLAHQIGALQELLPMFPGHDAWIKHGIDLCNSLMTWANHLLTLLGNGLMGIGAVAKIGKLFGYGK